MKSLTIYIIIFIFFAFGKTPGFAADPEYKASAPAVVNVGRAFNYVISFSENTKIAVQLPQLEGIRIVGGPSTFMSTQTSYVNGKVENTTTVSYTYALIALSEGRLIIPASTIKDGNKTYQTNSVEIEVIAESSRGSQGSAGGQSNTGKQGGQDSDNNYYIKLLPSKRSLYVGEHLLVEAKIFTNTRLSFSEVKYPEFEGFLKTDLESEQQASREVIDGREYLTQVFKRDLLLAQKTGNLQVKPIEVTVLVQKIVRSQRRSLFGDLFDDPFFDSYENVPEILNSNGLNIEVKALPSPSPDGFTGAVGNFTIDMRADKTQLKANEALSFILTIKGTGNLSVIGAPNLSFPHDVETFEAKASRNISNTMNGSSGSVSFEYVVIPRFEGNLRIPPFVFSYFDPVKQSYRSITTQETIITVEGNEGSDGVEISGGQQRIGNVMRERVGNLNTDILHIKTHAPEFVSINNPFTSSLLYRIAIPSGIALYFLLLILYRKRIRENNDIAYTRNKRARRKAERRLKEAKKYLGQNDRKMYEEIHTALWDFMSDKLNVPRSDLSKETISSALKKYSISEELEAELWNIIDECELAGYANTSYSDPHQIYNRAVELLYKFVQIL
jgi:hypothetical protein